MPRVTWPRLAIHPITLRAARAYVREHHRHLRPPQGGRFAVACTREGSDELVGVAIVGNPVARHLNDGWTLEVTRLASDGTKNVCSKLYGACWRAARALGFRRLVCYTLPEEGGSSLRGAHWKLIGETKGGRWSRQDRPRADAHPTQPKLRWELTR